MSRVDEWIRLIIKNSFWAKAVLCLLAVIVFINIMPNNFIMDDYDVIVNWKLIQTPKNFFRFFVYYIAPDGYEGIYSPLRTLSFSFIYTFIETSVLGWHIISILIHVFGVLAVYAITQKLFAYQWISFLTGLIFAVHPVQVESITAISGSINTIGVVLGLWSFYWYLKSINGSTTLGFINSGRKGKQQQEGVLNHGHFFISLILGAFAVFTYEIMLVLPILIFLFDLFFVNEKISFKRALRRALPFVIIAAAYLLIKGMVVGGSGVGLFGPALAYYGKQYFYLGSFAYSLILAVMIVGLYEKVKHRLALRSALVFVVLVMVCGYGLRTVIRNRDFYDGITFNEKAAARNPNNAYLKNDLAVVYMEEGNVEQAEDVLLEAIELEPENPDFYFSIAQAYAYSDQLSKAAQALKKSIELEQDFAEAYFNLAVLEVERGDAEQGKELLQKAVEVWATEGKIIEAGEAINSFQLFLLRKSGQLNVDSVDIL